MLGGLAAGLLTLTAAVIEASPMEKDEAAITVPREAVSSETGVRDEAMMVLVGSALIGAAAAVRRAA
jgi:hypothetical protein